MLISRVLLLIPRSHDVGDVIQKGMSIPLNQQVREAFDSRRVYVRDVTCLVQF